MRPVPASSERREAHTHEASAPRAAARACWPRRDDARWSPARCSTAPRRHQASDRVRIWTDADRKAAVTQVAGAWAQRTASTVKVVAKDFGKIRDDLRTVAADDAPDVIVGAHDWTGELAANGLVLPLFPTQRRRRSSRSTRSTRSRTAPPSSGSTAPRSRSRTSGWSSTRSSPRCRRPSRSSRKQALAFKKKSSGNLAHRRPAGLRRRRVPHVPVLLGPRRLRLRRQQGRQPRPVGHRRREPGVPEERDADRQVEQGRPDQLEDRLRDAQERVPEGQGRLLDHRPVGRRHAEGRQQAELQDRPGAEDQVQLGAVPRRQGLHGHEVRRDARRSRARRRTSSATT